MLHLLLAAPAAPPRATRRGTAAALPHAEQVAVEGGAPGLPGGVRRGGREGRRRGDEQVRRRPAAQARHLRRLHRPAPPRDAPRLRRRRPGARQCGRALDYLHWNKEVTPFQAHVADEMREQLRKQRAAHGRGSVGAAVDHRVPGVRAPAPAAEPSAARRRRDGGEEAARVQKYSLWFIDFSAQESLQQGANGHGLLVSRFRRDDVLLGAARPPPSSRSCSRARWASASTAPPAAASAAAATRLAAGRERALRQRDPRRRRRAHRRLRRDDALLGD